MGSGEVNFLGPTQADVVHIDALLQQSLRNGRLDRFTGEADIVTDDDLPRFDDLGKRAADAARDILVQLIRYSPANIIGLETG